MIDFTVTKGLCPECHSTRVDEAREAEGWRQRCLDCSCIFGEQPIKKPCPVFLEGQSLTFIHSGEEVKKLEALA